MAFVIFAYSNQILSRLPSFQPVVARVCQCTTCDDLAMAAVTAWVPAIEHNDTIKKRSVVQIPQKDFAFIRFASGRGTKNLSTVQS